MVPVRVRFATSKDWSSSRLAWIPACGMRWRRDALKPGARGTMDLRVQCPSRTWVTGWNA